MEWKKIVAIIRTQRLDAVGELLKGVEVAGLTVSRVKGYGEYANFLTRDWTVTHARFEIYCPSSKAEEIAKAIVETAHTGLTGDGIVAVIPVEKVYCVRTKTEQNGCDK
jgi:nitrogen regulatory protein P-II 1